MSIAQVPENINRKRGGGGGVTWIFGISTILNFVGFLGVGLLWERINTPPAIQILCSEEVLEGLRATSSAPIPKVKTMSKIR